MKTKIFTILSKITEITLGILFVCILSGCESLDKKNLKLWQKQADEIFTAITKAVKMIPCGEDLGVGIQCVPETMEAHKILGLRVVRWCRQWSKEGQPFIPFADYTPLSVSTTSVHDSSTLHQWWEEEKDSVRAFITANEEDFENISAEDDFSPEIAAAVLRSSIHRFLATSVCAPYASRPP